MSGLICYKVNHVICSKKLFKMMTQKQIDELLQDSSTSNINISTSKGKNTQKVNHNIQPKQHDNYDQSQNQYDDQFQSYTQSRATKQFQASYSKQFEQSRQQIASKTKLASIQEESGKKLNNKSVSQTKQNKKINETKKTQDKNYAPFNFARLQERQRQLLFTTVNQENNRLKYQLTEKEKQNKALQLKYNMLLSEKSKNQPSVTQKVLRQELENAKNKIQKLEVLLKAKQRHIPKVTSHNLSKKPEKYIMQEQWNQRQQEFLNIIDQLKERLLHSESQLNTVKAKMNEGLNYTEQLHRKLKRIEVLEHRQDKMTEQAQTDREYIDYLKTKINQLQKKVQQQRSRSQRLQIQMKKSELDNIRTNDIMNQLKQVKRQKQQLQMSLKQLSSTIMSNVKNNFQKKSQNASYEKMEDSNQIFKT